MKWLNRMLKISSLLVLLLLVTGCSTRVGGQAADMLNPFADNDVPRGHGERNNRAILGEGRQGDSADKARHALEVMTSYRRAQNPQPSYPVVQPAEVRLMWVPDHLNKAGDLVPAHYYYLKVLPDRWAVQDAFELEQQLNQGSSGASSATPWKYGK